MGHLTKYIMAIRASEDFIGRKYAMVLGIMATLYQNEKFRYREISLSKFHNPVFPVFFH